MQMNDEGKKVLVKVWATRTASVLLSVDSTNLSKTTEGMAHYS